MKKRKRVWLMFHTVFVLGPFDINLLLYFPTGLNAFMWHSAPANKVISTQADKCHDKGKIIFAKMRINLVDKKQDG